MEKVADKKHGHNAYTLLPILQPCILDCAYSGPTHTGLLHSNQGGP